MTAKGITTTGSILDRIVAEKRDELERRKKSVSREELLSRAAAYDEPWTLSQAITTPRGKAPAGAHIQIVAEIKKASPSKGVLAPDLDYRSVAEAYTEAGAAGISVLTEKNYFLGSLDWLRDVRLRLQGRYPGERPSLIRKDFVTEPYEVAEARAYGADNALLIVALLDTPLLRDLIAYATELGLDALVEVHNEDEAERALEAGTKLFGINNRDLHTFNVDLATTERIRPLLPPGAIVIGESGVHTRTDSQRLYAAGVSAILVGEAFMTAPDVAAKMAALRI
jgi:indole-3-glycerol phosphate synthase